MPQSILETVSLLGPWRIDPSKGTREQVHFASIAHWYFSAQFDPRMEPEHVKGAILKAKSSAVVSYTKKFHDASRRDWALIRGKVLLQGLQLMRQQNPGVPVLEGDAPALIEALADVGISGSGVGSVVQAFVRQRQAPRVAILGAAEAPAKEVGKRVNALHKRLAGMWSLTHWMGRRVAWSMHDWADNQRLQIQYVGATDDRLTPAAFEQIIAAADSFLVFERRGGKVMDRVTRAIKASGKPLEVALWVEDSVATIPDVISLLVSSPRAAPLPPSAGATGDMFGESEA